MMHLGWLVVAIILSAAMAVTVKFAAHNKTPERHVAHYLILGIVFSIALVGAFYYLFSTSSLSVGYAVTKIASIVLAVIAGMWFFSERLSMMQLCGIGLGLVSIYLITA